MVKPKVIMKAKIIKCYLLLFCFMLFSSRSDAGQFLIPQETEYSSVVIEKDYAMAVLQVEPVSIGIIVYIGAITELNLALINSSDKTIGLEPLGIFLLRREMIVEPVSPSEAAYIVRPYGEPPPPRKIYVAETYGNISSYGYNATLSATSTIREETPLVEGIAYAVKKRKYLSRLQLEEEFFKKAFKNDYILAKSTAAGTIFFPLTEKEIKEEQLEVRVYLGEEKYISIPFSKYKKGTMPSISSTPKQTGLKWPSQEEKESKTEEIIKVDEGKNVEDISKKKIIKGKIIAVNYITSEVNINLGENDGIKEGVILIIKRDGEEIGKILITDVKSNYSTGKIKEGNINTNDTVVVE